MRCVSVFFLAVALCSVSQGQEPPAPPNDAPPVAVHNQPAAAGTAIEKHSVIESFVQRTRFSPDVAENKAPLSVGGKFRLFAFKSVSPANMTRAAAAAGLGQALDHPEGYGQGGEGYGKRFGANMATGASSAFFGTFLIPSVLHQDPRFFRQGSGSLGQSVKYALRHVVVTKNDKGDDAFNWSGILAPIAAQSVANTYLPEHERTVGKTFIRSGRMIGITVGVNVLKEYWPTISRKLSRRGQQ